MTDPREALDRLTRLAATVENEDDARWVADLISAEVRRLRAVRWEPYAWQHPHSHPTDRHHRPDCPPTCKNPHLRVCADDCFARPLVRVPTHGTWLNLGGRGTGKTEGCARYVDVHAQGPPCDPRLPGGHRMLIVAPTQGDAVEACWQGPSGMATINPSTRLVGGAGGLHIRWANGSRARLLGAFGPEDVERLRAAGNNCLVWLEEAAAQRRLADALTHTRFGLRIGARPHYVASTTPKPRPELRGLIADPTTVITKGRTEQAHHLDPSVRDAYFAEYANTRIGRQELDAELLDDVEGALWTLAMIDQARHKGPLPIFDHTVVAVDPPGSSTAPGAEAGIVVAARADRDAWVLADLSGPMTPEEWGRTAVDAFYRYGCRSVAVETTYGGEMTISTIRTVDDTVPITRVPTKVGKRLRAEPVVALYEQARIHHVGILAGLETQQTEWIPGVGESPDRVDALVHAITLLLVKGGRGHIGNPTGMRRPVRIDRPQIPPHG